MPADSSGSFDVAISKGYTRLATRFSVFNQHPPADNSGKAKLVHTNYFPTAQSEDVSYHLAMGSRRVLDNDVRGSTEAWWKLGGALGLGNSLAHSTSVDAASYKCDCFAIGIDVDKMPLSCTDCAKYVCNWASIHSQCCDDEDACNCDVRTEAKKSERAEGGGD